MLIEVRAAERAYTVRTVEADKDLGIILRFRPGEWEFIPYAPALRRMTASTLAELKAKVDAEVAVWVHRVQAIEQEEAKWQSDS